MTRDRVDVPGTHALVAQEEQPIGERVVVGGDRSALPRCEVLRGVEAEGGRPEAADARARQRRAVRLGGVLDHARRAGCELAEGADVGGLTVEVDRQTAACGSVTAVAALSAASRSRSSAMSANAPSRTASRTAFKVATNVNGLVTTSSPGSDPRAWRERPARWCRC